MHVGLLGGGAAPAPPDIRAGSAHYSIPAKRAEIPAARDGRQVLHM